jgi:hypothetical protein
MYQTANIEIKGSGLRVNEEQVVLILNLETHGTMSFLLEDYSKVVELLKVYPEGLENTRYARLVVTPKGEVRGLAHITKDVQIILVKEAEQTEAPVV